MMKILDTAWLARRGLVWCGEVMHGTVRRGALIQGEAGEASKEWCGTAWSGAVRLDMARHGLGPRGKARLAGIDTAWLYQASTGGVRLGMAGAAGSRMPGLSEMVRGLAGEVRLGATGCGSARHGRARRGVAWLARCALSRRGVARPGWQQKAETTQIVPA